MKTGRFEPGRLSGQLKQDVVAMGVLSPLITFDNHSLDKTGKGIVQIPVWPTDLPVGFSHLVQEKAGSGEVALASLDGRFQKV